MYITLRAGERFLVNGAVIRIDRKATIELLNDVTFLLESHVMQAKDATTLTRQIYFAVQIMLMDPSASATAAPLASSLIEAALGAYRAPELIGGLIGVAQSLARSRNFEAMKALRGLFPLEDRELGRPKRPRMPADFQPANSAAPGGRGYRAASECRPAARSAANRRTRGRDSLAPRPQRARGPARRRRRTRGGARNGFLRVDGGQSV